MATETGIADRSTRVDHIQLPAAERERHETVTGAEADVNVPHLVAYPDPAPHDVLFGRGEHQHPGNRNYLDLVMEQKDRYANGTKWDKLVIVTDIISNLRDQDPPVRFLMEDDNTGLWIEVRDEDFAKKVRRALNDRDNNRNQAPQVPPPQVAPIANESQNNDSVVVAAIETMHPREDVRTQDEFPIAEAILVRVMEDVFAESVPWAESSSTSQTEEDLRSIDSVDVWPCAEVEEPSNSKMDGSALDLDHPSIENGHFCPHETTTASQESCKQASLDSDDWAYVLFVLALPDGDDCEMLDEELESMSCATATIPSDCVAFASDEPSSTTTTTTTTPNGQSNNELPNVAVKSPPLNSSAATEAQNSNYTYHHNATSSHSSNSSTMDISAPLASGEESRWSGSLFSSPSAHADTGTGFFWSDHSNNNNIAVDMMQHPTAVATSAMKRVPSNENETEDNKQGSSVKPAALDRNDGDGASPTVKRQPSVVVDLSRQVSVTDYYCCGSLTPAEQAFIAALNGTDSSCHDGDRAMQELAQNLERSTLEEMGDEEVNEFGLVSTETFNAETTMSLEDADEDTLRLLPFSRTNSSASLKTASSGCMSTNTTSWDLDDELLECAYRPFWNKNAE